LALHQQAAYQLGGDQLGGSGEEGWGEGLKVLWRMFSGALNSISTLTPTSQPFKAGSPYIHYRKQ